MEAVFDAFQTVDDVHSGGEGKKLFFVGDMFPPELITASFPAPLGCLVNQLRLIFKNRYTNPPPSIHSVSASCRAEVQKEWDRYYQVQERAKAKLSTSDAVIQTFEECLAMEGWGDENAPQDRLGRVSKTEKALELVNKRKRAQSLVTPTNSKKFKKATGTGG